MSVPVCDESASKVSGPPHRETSLFVRHGRSVLMAAFLWFLGLHLMIIVPSKKDMYEASSRYAI
jgi:hypothetical protein